MFQTGVDCELSLHFCKEPFPNRYEMKKNPLQDGIDIGDMLPTSKMNQYYNL